MSAITFPGHTAPSGAAAQLTNEDLLPTPPEQRKWTWWHFSALWMGMVHNIFNFTWVGGLVALGMSVWQALLVALVGNLIQTIFIGLNGRVGARFGTPFAVWARSVFGVYGANIAALLRGLVAIGWFGVQSYLAATAMNLLVATAIPAWNDLGHGGFLGMAPNLWISMVVYWILNFLVVQHGMHTVRRFASWAGPAIFVVMLILLIWVVSRAGGTGTLLVQPSLKYHTAGAFFGNAFFPAVALYIAGSWASMVLNIPDLTRFARTNKGQFWGTMIGLPAASLVYFGMAAVIVSAAQTLFGKLMWNPTDVIQAVGNPALSIFGAALLVIATISVNIPSNVVSPAYDLTNLLPRWLTFRRGAYIAMILAFVYMPWKLMENPAALYGVLDNIGVVLGPITGIMIADFFVLRHRRLDVDDLYRSDGRYRYQGGFNLASIAVLVGTCALLFVGEFSGPGLHWAYEYAWPAGVAIGFVAYYLVGRLMQQSHGATATGLARAGIEGEDAGYVFTATSQAAQ